MVRQYSVGASEDKVIAVLVHLLLALCCKLHLLVSGSRLPACQDRPVVVPSEVSRALKHLGVAEAGHSVELHDTVPTSSTCR